MAWAVSRTDMPGKMAIRLLTLGTFITPPYLGALAWIFLAGPNAGWLNGIWRGASGVEGAIFNIFSFPGLVFIIAIYSYPYIFVFTSAALDTVSSEMEDAASIHGAGIWTTTFRVTLPLVLPAMLGGAIITFLESIALFGSPAMIAIPARYNVVTTQLLEFFSYPVRVEVAAAYALPLLAITILLYGLQQRIIGRRGHVTHDRQGRGSPPDRARSLALRCMFGGCLFVVPAVGAPAGSSCWRRPPSPRPGGADSASTISPWAEFQFRPVREPGDLAAALNSFWFSAAAASLALGLRSPSPISCSAG